MENKKGKGNQLGFDASIFRKAIKIAAGTNDLVPVTIFDAIVQDGSQDSTSMTCYIDSVDNTVQNLQVRYNLCISDGVVQVPADGSTVTIAKTSFTDPYIVKCSDLNSIFIGIGNQSWSNDGNVQDFEFYVSSGEVGSFGGFIKSIDPSDSSETTLGLKARLNILEKDLNNLKTALASLCTVIIDEPGSGAPSAFQAAFSSALTGAPAPNPTPLPSSYCGEELTETSRTDIENENITHGLTLLPS